MIYRVNILFPVEMESDSVGRIFVMDVFLNKNRVSKRLKVEEDQINLKIIKFSEIAEPELICRFLIMEFHACLP